MSFLRNHEPAILSLRPLQKERKRSEFSFVVPVPHGPRDVSPGWRNVPVSALKSPRTILRSFLPHLEYAASRSA